MLFLCIYRALTLTVCDNYVLLCRKNACGFGNCRCTPIEYSVEHIYAFYFSDKLYKTKVVLTVETRPVGKSMAAGRKEIAFGHGIYDNCVLQQDSEKPPSTQGSSESFCMIA